MKYIDLQAIISKSDSKLLNSFPRVFVKLLEKLIKQEELNQLLTKYKSYEGIHFLPKVLEELNIKIDIEGLENLPESGKCFFVANHPFGVIDGLMLTRIVSEKYGDIKSIGNEAFMYVPNLKPMIAAVNVFGRNSRDYLLGLEEVYASNTPITHFPAGLVARKDNGIVKDSEWHKSFVTKALAHQRDVVPFHFSGQNSRLFHSIYRIRKALGIKLNLELSLLPHEIFNKKNKTFKVKIGKPISYKNFENTYSHKEWADKIRMQVHNMN
ncbi:MAG: 1-acyl-sn-glycerol-3-phosphate acyltransferase [Bacteroidales bacterium]|nr:1-acyl-sn-glycerol-3-phosphate acyltransferase [Bacteroidales bacterium]